MNNIEFTSKIKNTATRINTVYASGCFGQIVNASNIKKKAEQYPKWYTDKRIKMFEGLYGKNYFAFDCVGLIKGTLWGFNGDVSKTYGGVSYKSNNVPDYDDTKFFNLSSDISTDFSKIQEGELLWKTGHVGIYIGGGLAVECTSKWSNKVQITAVENIGKQNGYNSSTWKKHGKCPYITYDNNVTVNPEKPVITQPVKYGLVRVTTSGGTLNMREKPSINSKVITCFANGTDLNLLEKTTLEWWKVKWKDYIGYCNVKYLRERR